MDGFLMKDGVLSPRQELTRGEYLHCRQINATCGIFGEHPFLFNELSTPIAKRLMELFGEILAILSELAPL